MNYIDIGDASKYSKEELKKLWTHNDKVAKLRGDFPYCDNGFKYDYKGRIKGHYTEDGFFEPE